MMFRKSLTACAVALALAIGVASTSSAEEKHKNLKVIKGGGKDVEAGMKLFAKGLGVKCNACHVKGEFDSDKVPEKIEARKFLTATVGEKDATKRADALKALLDAMKMKEAKSADDIWKGVDSFTKQ